MNNYSNVIKITMMSIKIQYNNPESMKPNLVYRLEKKEDQYDSI